MKQRWARAADPPAVALSEQLIAGFGPGWDHPTQHPHCWEPDWVVLWQPDDSGRPTWWSVFAPKRLRAKIVPLAPARVTNAWRLVGSTIPGYGTADPTFHSWPTVSRLAGSPLQQASFFLDEIDESSAVIAAVRASGSPARRHMPAASSWTMQLPTDIEAFWARFGRKTRYNMQRSAKRLGATLHRVTAAEQMAWFYQLAEQVARRSWQAEDLGLRISASEAVVSRMERQARAGIVRNYLLTVGETPVAFVLGLIGNGVMRYEEIGYDQEFSKQSPGTVLLTQIVEDLIESGDAQVLDFGLGDAPYKRQFATDTTMRGSWVLPATLAERTVWWAHERGVAVRGAARRIASRLRAGMQRPAPPAPPDAPGSE